MKTATERLSDLARSPFGTGRLKVLQVITGAMLAGAFLIGLVFFFLAPIREKEDVEKAGVPKQVQIEDKEMANSDLPLLLVAGLLGIGSVTFSTIFTLYQTRRNQDALAGADNPLSIEQMVNSTFTVGILTNAIMEGALLVSCMFGLVASNPNPYFAVAGVILILWVMRFPTRQRFERILGLGD